MLLVRICSLSLVFDREQMQFSSANISMKFNEITKNITKIVSIEGSDD